MSLRYMLPSLVVMLAVGIGIADDITESAEAPFGTYTLEGRERFERDPYIAMARLELSPGEGEIHFTYTNPALLPWHVTLDFDPGLDEIILEELERGQGIRRRFTFTGVRYREEVRGQGLLHMRKNNDGEFRLAVQYSGELIRRTEEEEEEDAAAEGEGDGDDDADEDADEDDDDEDEEDEEPREIITVVGRFTGNVSGTQSDDEEDED